MVDFLVANVGSSAPCLLSDVRQFVLCLLPKSRERLPETHVVAGSVWKSLDDGAIRELFDTWLSRVFGRSALNALLCGRLGGLGIDIPPLPPYDSSHPLQLA